MSFSVRPKKQSTSSGIVWPDTGNDTPSGVGAVFGARLFPAHVATVGYDYDFHPGADVALEVGDDLLSPINGTVLRLQMTHFGWELANQLNYWTADSDGPGATWSAGSGTLTGSGTRGGAQTFPTVDKLYRSGAGASLTADSWEMRFKLGAGQSSIAGAIGFGFHNDTDSQYVTMEWDGTNVYAYGARSGGNVTSHGSSAAIGAERWLRVRSNGGNLVWSKSTDGATWTTVWTEANPTFTNPSRPIWKPVIYWRSKDTNATPDALAIDFVGWYDENTIPRFGNHITISRAADKIVMIHFSDFYVSLGDYVYAGQPVGVVGLTGFDDISGNVTTTHVHFEYHPNSLSIYSRAEGVNPFDSDIMPRTNVSNNVSVVQSSANDPDAVDSHKLAITCTRGAQDFDINEIQLVGSSATRTINFNSRSGLNANVDIPKQSGVYFVAKSFNSASSSYTLDVYFNKSVVGATITSAYIKDCNGVTLWSV